MLIITYNVYAAPVYNMEKKPDMCEIIEFKKSIILIYFNFYTAIIIQLNTHLP